VNIQKKQKSCIKNLDKKCDKLYKMVCAACLAAPVVLITGVSSMYYNTLFGLIITIIFCLIYLYNQPKKESCLFCR
jgi:ABC-type Mn2+/Zn2+ transport system permease subunit